MRPEDLEIGDVVKDILVMEVRTQAGLDPRGGIGVVKHLGYTYADVKFPYEAFVIPRSYGWLTKLSPLDQLAECAE